MEMISKKKRNLLLIALSASTMMVFLDESAVGVTLPSIQHDIGLSSLGMQWVMNSFLLLLAIFVLAGGRMADYVGHRKVFLLGMTIFLISSLFCGIAETQGVLISARAFQGLGASLLVPTSMTIINMYFPFNERGTAMGTVVGFSSLFMAAGPFIGGFFAQDLSWRLIFLFNIPLAIISIAFVLTAITHDIPPHAHCRFDKKGLSAFAIALSALIIGLTSVTNLGWTSPLTISLFLIALIGFILFAWIEIKTQWPLINFYLFRNKAFLAGNIILFCGQQSVISMIFWAIWLQKSLGLSPLIAGLALLPTTGPIIIFARMGGVWLDRYGPRLPIILGTGLIMIGTFWIALMALENSYLWILFGLLCCGVGTPLIMPTAITTVISSAPQDQHGMAAGTLNTLRQVGAALGLAVIGTVINSYELSKTHTTHLTSSEYASVYTHAFSYGIFASALFALVAFIFAITCLPKRLHAIEKVVH
ncbi:MAG: MFS transporter [Coxiellaceae bacterium]|nr:MFS transporter [Coxiellaceae bacterium]